MRDFLRKITKHDILGNKERGFPQEHESSLDDRMIFLTNQNCISFAIF